MSKRKREAAAKGAISKNTAETAHDESPDESQSALKRQSRWGNMSAQGKLLTVLVIGMLSLGVLGAGWKFLDENARQTMTQRRVATPLNPSQEGMLSKINPLIPNPTPEPTPQLSKEYIYAGSRLLAVEDANATASVPADLAVFRPTTGGWWVLNSSGQGYTGQTWGTSGDVPVPGDFDGDGKTDFSIFHPADGSWQVLQSSNGASYGFQFGVSSDKTAQADYDGDGRTDLAIYRPDQSGLGVWYIRKSGDSSVVIQQFGLPSDLPAPADYDGDGKADIGVWRQSNQTFYSVNSSNNMVQIIYLGHAGLTVVSGDYDGDGRADYAIHESSTTISNWHIRSSISATVQTTPWGTGGDVAAQNDYDGDGKVDLTTWTSSTGIWHIRNSSNNTTRNEQWGQAGDIPVPSYYRR